MAGRKQETQLRTAGGIQYELTRKRVKNLNIRVREDGTVAAFLFEQPAMAEFVTFAGPILYCGVMSSGVAYTLQILGQRDLNPAVASLIMCLESVFSALGGWLLLHQNLSFRESTGCVLLFAAVVLAQLPLGRLMRSKA